MFCCRTLHDRFLVFLTLVIVFSCCSNHAIAQDNRDNKLTKASLQDIATTPSWIWHRSDDSQIHARRDWNIEGTVKQAFVAASADNKCEIFFNDKKVLASDDWSQIAVADILKHSRQGINRIAITAANEGGPSGLMALFVAVMDDGRIMELGTDSSWIVSEKPKPNWKTAKIDDLKWSNASVIGKLGDGNLPWSGNTNRETLLTAFGSDEGGEFRPEIAANAKVPDGFKIERIFHVPRAMGSWVALTTDNRGRLIASDQGGAGLFVITPGNEKTPTQVEKLPVPLSGAQGLLWAFDSLYAVVNGGDKSGLHRLTDTDGDGKVDKDEHLMFVPGGGEHGPHAVILSPDGKSLFVAAGNHTKLPEKIAGSKIPQNWNEDHLLPRRWDANGHAAGILAPGGWICQVDPAGKNWTVYSMGYRNQYDIAFNGDGELFTYDADMEWDFGSPWYRPTRVCHATSGSEFGWRSGTGKWPAYYEDSLPAAVDIGPGSPTGIVFGSGAKFPAKYQRSLFILDWTYSTIYSVQLSPDGSSYRGTKEDFVTGTPLPVTDAVIGDDGALYFAAGGRGTQSDLYRVSYVGSDSTEQVPLNNTVGADQRAIRRRLEAFHGTTNGDVDFIVSHLGNPDRFVRYAARVALENIPVSQWRERAFGVPKTKASLNAMLAIAHQGDAKDLPRLIDTLEKSDFQHLTEEDQLIWIRVLQVAFARHGRPTDEARKLLLKQLEPLYPSASFPINAELVQLLIFLESNLVVEKTLALMDQLGPEPIPEWSYLVNRNAGYGGTVGKMLSDMPPVRGIHFAFMLRNVKNGWTLEQRKKYFQFFIDASKKPGGNSYGKFLMQFRDDALASCTPAELVVLDPLISQSLLEPTFDWKPAKGPGKKWTTSDALAALGEKLEKPNFESGRNLYHATSCSKCHRIAGEGGAIGPDLSTAGKKFSQVDMLDAIIDPSKAISDQYGSQQILTEDGESYVGRVVEIGDEYYVYTIDTNAKPIVLKKKDVQTIKTSKVSQMPVGLIDTLNEQELRDLMAYVMSGADRKSNLYK